MLFKKIKYLFYWVFKSNDVNKLWNGREQNNGKECADGVYFYILNLTDNKRVETQHKGSVTILR
ncbi:MAG: gliding motility-associated C-terminal domain-containing protein [Bacteroidetes bacterium]|nr:gliding motility-associated C-terminal domain-containing protein [Bacteroidota bacterium]